MDIVKQSVAITFVFALLWAALWFLRKRGNIPVRLANSRAADGVLQSRGQLALGPLHSIHLVRIGEQDLIIAVHPGGVTELGKPAHALNASGSGNV
jgi:flagellar biogenesis protein FliO